MKFGLPLFGVSPRFYADIARAAEDNGFESVWMPEHLVFPEVIPPTYPYSESGYPMVTADTPLFDPWVVLSFIADATSSIRLATNVFVLPLRHPIAVARSVVTLDRVSNGRVTLGIGVGWLEEEFDALGQSFHDRGKRADAMIPLLRRLWSDDVIEEHNEHFDIGPVKFQPKPRQGSIPIEVGGTTAPALRRAGRLGDGWIEVGSPTLEVSRREARGRARRASRRRPRRGALRGDPRWRVRRRPRRRAPQRGDRRDPNHRGTGADRPHERRRDRRLHQALRRRGDHPRLRRCRCEPTLTDSGA